jgi:rhodanese-related sulfurtransferase
MGAAHYLILKVSRGAIVLILLSAIPAAFAWMRLSVATETLLPGELSIQDTRLAAKDVVWVDARPEVAYKEGHVPGAVSLDEEKWDTGLEKLFETWQPERLIVVYCNAGCEASHKVADKLRDLGLDPIFVLKGGYEAWKQAHPKSGSL